MTQKIKILDCTVDEVYEMDNEQSLEDFYKFLKKCSLDELWFAADDIDYSVMVFLDSSDALRLKSGEYVYMCWRGEMCRVWKCDDPQEVEYYDSQLKQ